MNRERLNWGLIVLFIGVVWLLSNLGVIQFHWWGIWRYWPVFLVIIGVNLLVPKNMLGNVLSVVFTVGVLVFVGFQASKPSDRPSGFGWDPEEDSLEEGMADSSSYSAPFDSTVTQASLKLSGGAIAYFIGKPTAELIDAKAYGLATSHKLSTNTKDGESAVELSMKNSEGKKWNWNGDTNDSRLQIALNRSPAWDITIEAGAGTAELDLSDYRLSKFQFKGGASAMEATLGRPHGKVDVNVDAGAASVAISIPRDAACKIFVSTGMSSNDFDGFESRGKNTYVTPGYSDSLANSYQVRLKGGLASFEVNRNAD